MNIPVKSYKQLKVGDEVASYHARIGSFKIGKGTVVRITPPNDALTGFVDIDFDRDKHYPLTWKYLIPRKKETPHCDMLIECMESSAKPSHLYLVYTMPPVCLLCKKWCAHCACKLCQLKRKEVPQSSFLETENTRKVEESTLTP